MVFLFLKLLGKLLAEVKRIQCVKIWIWLNFLLGCKDGYSPMYYVLLLTKSNWKNVKLKKALQENLCPFHCYNRNAQSYPDGVSVQFTFDKNYNLPWLSGVAVCVSGGHGFECPPRYKALGIYKLLRRCLWVDLHSFWENEGGECCWPKI
jgi:hypothetical protein